MEDDTAGDPVSGCKWTRKTTAKVAAQLRRIGLQVSPNTVARLLREADGVAIPHGIHDLSAMEGFVSIGTSCDTSELAVDSIGR